MGGLALKNTFTRRYSREEFDAVSKELIEIIERQYDSAETPLFYSSKDSFGDIDIIVTENKDIDTRDYITQTFRPNEIFHNGNCWSFDYKEVQVDFMIVAPEYFESNYHYLAYNDLGNFIGRIAQKLGFKYGQEGLWYNHVFKGQNIGKVYISKDYPKIFNFLGFNYERWEEGFETLEDIFSYVVHSQYFDSEMYALNHLNKVNRERNAKRKSYMSFLEYIDERHPDVRYQFANKDVYMDRAKRVFPDSNIEVQIREMEYLKCRELYVKSKFNGRMVIDRYGLKGKELGNSLTNFKFIIEKSYEGRWTYEEFIIKNPIDVILTVFEASLSNSLYL